jgi:hypothetical protein
VSGVVVDTSSWIEFFAARPAAVVDDALAQGAVVLAPIVVAELLSGAHRAAERRALTDFLKEVPLHDTQLAHWLRVGELRRHLKEKGLDVSTPDAHVAQCALDRDALLVTQDAIFAKVARVTRLRVQTASG